MTMCTGNRIVLPIKRSALSNVTVKSCRKRKISLFSSLNYLVQQGKEKRKILSYAIPPGTNWCALLQLQLLKIHFYHKSHNRGTYIARVHRPTVFPRVMHRTIFRDTWDTRMLLFLHWRNNEDGTPFLTFIRNKFINGELHVIGQYIIIVMLLLQLWRKIQTREQESVSIFALRLQYGWLHELHKFIFKPLYYV